MGGEREDSTQCAIPSSSGYHPAALHIRSSTKHRLPEPRPRPINGLLGEEEEEVYVMLATIDKHRTNSLYNLLLSKIPELDSSVRTS